MNCSLTSWMCMSVERNNKMLSKSKLKKELRRVDELKWILRAKEKDLKDGDRNVKYFHMKASGSEKKKVIHVMYDTGIQIKGVQDLLNHVTDFYKDLFGPSEITSIKVDGIECSQLTQEDNVLLTSQFTMEETRETVFEMEHNKAARPFFPAKHGSWT